MTGDRTGEFGKWLVAQIKEKSLPYRVYYDHGEHGAGNVGKIQGFVGVEAKRDNILTNVDVMVVNPQGEIKLLIEIEDKAALVPKKTIGTIFTTIMCNRFAFGVGDEKQYFSMPPNTKLIIAGFFAPKGNKLKQLNQIIIPRIHDFESLEDGIKLENIAFVFEGDIETTIESLKEHVISIL